MLVAGPIIDHRLSLNRILGHLTIDDDWLMSGEADTAMSSAVKARRHITVARRGPVSQCIGGDSNLSPSETSLWIAKARWRSFQYRQRCAI